MEVAEGIPAPFPLVAHDPAAQAPRPPPRAPRQASRATMQAFATCLLSDPPQPLDRAQDPRIRAQRPATAGMPAASDPVLEQHDCKNDQGSGSTLVGDTQLLCDDRREHVGDVPYYSRHAQHHQHAAGSAPTREAVTDTPVGGNLARPHSPTERLMHPDSLAEELTQPDSPAECLTQPDSSPHVDPAPPHAPAAAAHHPALPYDLHNQSERDWHERPASPGCQQQGYPGAEPSQHPADIPEPAEGALPACSQHAEHHVTKAGLEHQQRRQSYEHLPNAESYADTLQKQQHQREMCIAGSQHDQMLEQAPDQSQASGSPYSAPHPAPSPTALPAPHQAQPLPLVGPTSLLPLSQPHSSPPEAQPRPHSQPPHRFNRVLPSAHARADTSGHARDEPTADSSSTHAICAPSVAIVSNHQHACATPAATAAQLAVGDDCLQAAQLPQRQRQPEVSLPLHSEFAHPAPHQQHQQSGSPAVSLHWAEGKRDKADALSGHQQAGEHFEQDELSQASSSESDEDFQPSEYEQDELSQPSSSSDDADEGGDDDTFEVDELSQPESSSEDEQSPLRPELAPRVQSPRQAHTPHLSKLLPQGLRDPSFNPQSTAAAALGRSGVRRSRQGSLSDDHKARLGFPKPAQSPKAGPGPQGHLKDSRLPLDSQNMPLDQLGQGQKRPAQGVTAQHAGQKRMRTAAPKAGAIPAHRPSGEHGLQAQAAQKVCYCCSNKTWCIHQLLR